MTVALNKPLLGRTSLSCWLIFDYFLFSVGLPSFTYSCLGGWFVIPLLAAAISFVSCWYAAESERLARRSLVLHSCAVVSLAVGLFAASPDAREFAIVRLDAEIDSFVKDPTSSGASASTEARRLMVEIGKHPYSMEREAFIPTFRRMDYLLGADTGEKYRLIMTMSWNGTPVISLRRVDS